MPALQRSRVSSGMRVYANGNSGSRMHGGHVHNTWMGNAAHNVKGKSRVADFVPACIDWTGFLLVGYSGPISGPDYNRGGTRSTAGILASFAEGCLVARCLASGACVACDCFHLLDVASLVG